MRRVISSSLSPNTQLDDVFRALSVLLRPWVWQKGDAIDRVENWFEDYFKTRSVATYNSGRSALLALLQAFDIGAGDEVIVQAFTCVAVPNSVLWAGARPVYADIDRSYNIDPNDLEKKITKKTKAIVIQHTFGIPAQVDRIVAIAKRQKLLIIEDCAHSLGATVKEKKLGTFGDGAFYSFGRDKVISSVWGGAAIINDKCQMTNAKWKLKELHLKLPMPSKFWILRQLLHPVAFSLILPSYNIGIGKVLLVLLQKFHLLSFPVNPMEKIGKQPKDFPATYPNALASLLLNQLTKLDGYNKQRQHIAAVYNKKFRENQLISDAIYLRYPTFSEHPERVFGKAKEHGILLGNWYHNIIDPKGVSYKSIGYVKGSCPKAEYAATHIVNLPTKITFKEADDIIRLFDE